jgi:hypothetical protein
MSAGRCFRFEASVVATSLLAGESKDYQIKGADGALLFSCRTVGGGTTRPTVLLDADGAEVATLAARRRVLNFAYDLFPAGGGAALAAFRMQVRVRRSWRIELPPGTERFSILDAETAARSLMRNALGGSPDVYLVLEGERAVARVEQSARPLPEQAPTGRLGHLRRRLLSALPPQDWTLLLDDDLPADRTLVLIAATLLLQDHTIRGSRTSV